MAHITEVLKRPVLTERSLSLQADNKYTFDVNVNSNKVEIRQAVEAMFNVKVASVHTINVKPKTRRVGKFEGKTSRRKKAIVTLAEGHSINLFGEE